MKITRPLILAGITAVFMPGLSTAQDSKNQGYLVDT